VDEQNNIFFDRANRPEWFSDRGVWGQGGRNLTWEELNREQGMPAKGFWGGGGDYIAVSNPNSNNQYLADRFKDNGSALNSFYTQQDTKYANTADTDERAYNTIQDFLNSGKTKKTQGFKVRG
jgi:hypothetical protein